MKYLFLFLLAGCVKNLPCNQRILYPIELNLENQFSYIDVKVGNPAYGYGVYYKNIKDTIDITDRIVNGRTFIEYSIFCYDGSYKTIIDTIIIKL